MKTAHVFDANVTRVCRDFFSRSGAVPRTEKMSAGGTPHVGGGGRVVTAKAALGANHVGIADAIGRITTAHLITNTNRHAISHI